MPIYTPASLQSAQNLLFRREKQDIAPAISSSYRKRMQEDPRYERVQQLQESALSPIPNSGWAGALAQVFSGYMAGKKEKALEKDYLDQQTRTSDAMMGLVETEGDDPFLTQLSQSGIPELQELAVTALIKKKTEKSQPEYTYQDVNGEVVGLNKNNPNDRVSVGKVTPKDERTSDQKDYEFAMKQLPEGQPRPTFTDWSRANKSAGASRTSVTLNAPGQKDPKWGEAPNGYTFLRDPGTGEVLTDADPRGGVRPRIAPMVGSEEDNKRREAEAKANQQKRNQFNQANIVLRTIDDAKKKIGKMTTGLGGAVLSNVPGTKAYDLSKDLETIKANAAFDELQKMRAASPTGGALGAVERSEMLLLQSTIASVEQAQSEDELREALDRHAAVYDAVVNGGPDEAMRVFNQKPKAEKSPGVIRYDAQGNRVR